MTKAETVKTIRAMGLSCNWNSEWREFCIDYRRQDGRYTTQSSYHCSDSDDAIATAEIMQAWGKQL